MCDRMHRTVTITPIFRPSTFESGSLVSPREKVRYSVARPAHSSRTASTSDVARKVVPERRTALESYQSSQSTSNTTVNASRVFTPADVIGEIARVNRFVWASEHRGLKQGKVPCRSEQGVGRSGGARGFFLMEAFHQPSQRKSRVTNRGDPLGTCGERHDLAAARQ